MPQTGFDLSGRALPAAPDFTANLRANYTIPLPLGQQEGAITFSGVASYTDSYPWGPDFPSLREPEHVIVNLNANWLSEDGHYESGASVDNLTDVHGSIGDAAPGSGMFFIPRPPRWWHVSAAVHF